MATIIRDFTVYRVRRNEDGSPVLGADEKPVIEVDEKGEKVIARILTVRDRSEMLVLSPALAKIEKMQHVKDELQKLLALKRESALLLLQRWQERDDEDGTLKDIPKPEWRERFVANDGLVSAIVSIGDKLATERDAEYKDIAGN